MTMNESEHRRFVFRPSGDHSLPLIVESIGFNPAQEKIARPDGYPLYHWIQTVNGAGTLTAGSGKHAVDRIGPIVLPPASGMLLFPGDAHAYEADGGNWSTLYLTFGGAAAAGIVEAFGISKSSFFSFEPEAQIDRLLFAMLERIEAGEDRFGLETSADAYRFLGRLSKFGRLHHNLAIARNLEKLTPLLLWMEEHLDNPEAGLEDFAAVLGVSGRHLSTLFRQTFDSSPYAYFVQLRLRKAKELLTRSRDRTVGEIAGLTGFRDASHFVATFRKATEMTPEQFRRLH